MTAIAPAAALAAKDTLINATWVDYLLIALYFLFVLGIGFAARPRFLDACRLHDVAPNAARALLYAR